MASFADRVKEETSSTGTGTVNLNGAVAQHQSFVSGFGDGALARYGILSGDGGWEIGRGTVTDANPDTLSRDTILSNSNGDTSPITLTGTSIVFSTLPAFHVRSLGNGEFLNFDKASGNGLKVDTVSPTFGFADIIGDQFSKNTGATKPTLAIYNEVIQSFQFGAGDEVFVTYHIPHDYVKGTDIFLHIHWSHIGTLVTGGTITFKATSIYAKSHNQAAFTSTPAVGTFTEDASTTQYQHMLTETQFSASSPTGLQVDTDLLEPDGVIELTLEVDANDITVSGGSVPDPFIHYVDLHYQTTGLIGTKSRTPDFYT